MLRIGGCLGRIEDWKKGSLPGMENCRAQGGLE